MAGADGEFKRDAGRALLLALALFVLGGLSLTACGEGSDSGSEALVRQHEIAAARQQAAQDARQAERVRQLEREVASLKKGREQVPRDSSDGQLSVPGESEIVDLADDWPGGSGYTAILASLSSESEALDVQADATSLGLDAGILLSSDYASLRPGYWVVFSGTFGNVDAATERADRAHSLGYSDAYPRFVSR